MKIILTKSHSLAVHVGDAREFPSGTKLDLPDPTAKHLIEIGVATVPDTARKAPEPVKNPA